MAFSHKYSSAHRSDRLRLCVVTWRPGDIEVSVIRGLTSIILSDPQGALWQPDGAVQVRSFHREVV